MKKKCKINGCNNVRTGAGNGRIRELCFTHHRVKYNMKMKGGSSKKGNRKVYEKGVYVLSRQPCSKCGWNKSYVDRDRIDSKKGYTIDNVNPLCPNCHRIKTLGLLPQYKNRRVNVLCLRI